MKSLWKGCLAVVLGLTAQQVHAQEMRWQPVSAPAAVPANIGVRLLAPQPVDGVQPASLSEDDASPSRVVRAQNFDPTYPPAAPPVPPPPPPPPPPGSLANAGGDEKYNCAVKANCSSGSGGPGFYDQTKDAVAGIPQGIGNLFKGDSGRVPFQSDHCFDNFISPMSNPFYFVDPRALTEVRPLLIYDHVPSSNNAFQGGNIWFYGLQGSIAFTDTCSLIIEKLGAVTFDPHTTAHGISSSTGFADVMLGPQYTFLRIDNGCNKTVLAGGLIFDLPIGSRSDFQNTGSLALVPYVSYAQSFLKSSYGTFNFLNTTGYSFSIDNQRSDFLYSSFHLDYDVGNLNKIFPLIEMNWFHYTTNGDRPTTFGFEGTDLANFGSGGIAGHGTLSLAVGARYKFAEWFQTGLVVEFPLETRHDVMSYRIGLDLIFKY
jgi:hypothetical protein